MTTILILVLILAIIAIVIDFIAGAACGIRGYSDMLANRIVDADMPDELKTVLLEFLSKNFTRDK